MSTSKPRKSVGRARLRTAAFGWVIACGLFCGVPLIGGNGVAVADTSAGSEGGSSGGRDTASGGAATPGPQSARGNNSSSTTRYVPGDRTGPGAGKLDQLKPTPEAGAVRTPPPPAPPHNDPGAAVGGIRPLSAAASQGGIKQNNPRDFAPPLSPAAPGVPGMPAEPTVIDADTGSFGAMTLEPPPIDMPPLVGTPVRAELPLRLSGQPGTGEGSRGFARSGEGSVERQRFSPTASSGTTGVPESFRLGYPQYLREAKIGEVAVLALPGFAGLLALTALGGFLGYRQARAGHVPRTSGVSRFLQ